MVDKLVAFLADYYIWFLVGAGVFLFALVGLIIGTKKNRKKEGGDMLEGEAKPVEEFRNEAPTVVAPIAPAVPTMEMPAAPVAPAAPVSVVQTTEINPTPVVTPAPVAPVVEPTVVMPVQSEPYVNNNVVPEPVININDNQNTPM